ncbi:MAG: aminopeptidase P family protein, partial [Desulfovibrionaceae bacterium]|nr:aminopeptidase P family protein [Desulfovibrionaceae bacterium]
MQPYASRRERLRAKLRESGRAAMLVTRPADRYYLSGFELADPQCEETAGWLLVAARGRDLLLTDPRYEDAAKRLWPAEDLFIYAGNKWDKIGAYLGGLELGTILFDPRAVSVETHAKLAGRLALEPAPDFAGGLRRIKDAGEIERLRAALAVNQAVFDALPDMLEPGRTEADIAWEAEKFCRENGAEAMSFATIVGVGENAALPHAVPGETKITENCPVLIDLGARVNGYCSDQTRTFWVGGRPPDHFRVALEQVQLAQLRAIEGLAPGMSFAAAYALARDYFARFGVEKHFTHALGHGIGLEVHEYPSLSPTSQGALAPGMVVTVEPGLYYPGWGGVRWEHMVLITEDGA